MAYCHRCKRTFHQLGINRHVAMHRDKKENCTVTYLRDTRTYHFTRDGQAYEGEQTCLNIGQK